MSLVHHYTHYVLVQLYWDIFDIGADSSFTQYFHDRNKALLKPELSMYCRSFSLVYVLGSGAKPT